MKPLSCVATRRRLSAFLDGELPVADQVAVDGHLRRCLGCADELDAMRGVGDMLRAGSAAAAAARAADVDGLEADVLSRLAAEREESVSAQVSRAFQDMRLGLAAVCSTGATMVSVLLLVGIFYFAPLSERPDSLAGMMETLGAPAIGMDSRILSPRSSESGAMADDDMVSEEDEVFALAAVVTRNGRVVESRGAVEAVVGSRARAGQPAARRDLARAVRAGPDGRHGRLREDRVRARAHHGAGQDARDTEAEFDPARPRTHPGLTLAAGRSATGPPSRPGRPPSPSRRCSSSRSP